MSRKFKQMCGRLILVCVIAVLVPFQSFAATARITFSDPSAQVGSEVSVTMKFSSTDGSELGNTDVMLAYDATAMEYVNDTENASGGNGAIRVWSAPMGKTEAVTVLRFKALKAGTTQITISSWEGYDNDGQALTVEKEGTSTIKIAALQTSSNDARLQSLQVYPGTLEPGFSPDTTSYTTSVGLDVAKLTIDAKAANDKATVTIEGGSDLQEGENTVVCRVTAEDGATVQSYNITVNKVEGGAAETGAEGGKSETTAAAEPDVLAELDVFAKKIRITEVPADVSVPAGLKESSIQIGDAKVTGWISENQEKPEYCVIYGMNENGDQNFYRYDLTDKTVQRYFQDEKAAAQVTPEFEKQYNDMVDDYNQMRMIAMVLGGVAAVLFIAVIVMIAGRKRSADEVAFMEPKVQQKPEKKASVRMAGGRRLSKEERYMMGEEDEYVEEDPEDYMPEMADMDEDVYDEADYDQEELTDSQSGNNPDEITEFAPEVQMPAEDVEQVIARNLAKEAAAAAKEPEPAQTDDDEDDFEFFNLDDEK